MTRHSWLRGGLLAALLIATIVGAGAPFAAGPALAVGPGGRTLQVVPVRWCFMQGAPSLNDPGLVGEPDPDSVLWRRHERPTDRVWADHGVTFRSAITAAVLGADNFPVIPDSNTAVGDPGDVVDPSQDAADYKRVLADCETAWRNRNWLAGVPLTGLTAVSVAEFVDTGGGPSNLRGQGTTGIYSFSGGSSPFCTNPNQLTVTQAGGMVLADPSNAFLSGNNFENDALLVAHEAGHVMGLQHGDGIDNDDDGVFDGYPPGGGCDPDEADPGGNLMTASLNNANRTVTAAQRNRVFAFASKLSGGLTDPPGVLVPGPAIGDLAVDPYDDVGAGSVDLISFGLAVNRLERAVVFSHGLIDQIPDDETNQYLTFLDLDADATTGGRPDELGMPTDFEGAEVVVRVLVQNRDPQVTAWTFDGSTFQEFGGDLSARLETRYLSEDATPLNDVVVVQADQDLTGTIKPAVRLQAMAQQLSSGAELDVLPGGPGGGPGDGTTVHIVTPTFPVCLVEPGQVDPGDAVTVEATGFERKGEGVHVVLGDELIAQGTLDGNGTAVVDFVIPANADQGIRLVTVGVDDSALTADCVVQVGEAPVYEDEPAAADGTPAP